ncbi:CyP450 monooxygenase [Trametes punicea]|nr:CyP450 monooxygenase [Trametes punicea]
MVEKTRMIPPCAFVLCLLLLTYVRWVIRWRARARGRALPPGPQRLPVVGNMFNLPSPWKPWLGFRELMMEFGEIVYLEVLGQPVVLLGSPKVIFEFLEKQSATTSDRAQSALIPLVGQEFNLAFMPYGIWWRRHRRAFWQQFHSGVVSKYQPAQKAAVHRFLVRLLEKPAASGPLIQFCFSAAAFKAIYGVDIVDEQDSRLELIDAAAAGVRDVTVSMQLLLEFVPALRFLPTWTPWIGRYLKELAASRAPNDHLLHTEFDNAKACVDNGQDSSSVVAHLLARSKREAASHEEEQIAKGVAAVAVEAGTDTTFSTAQGFFQAMALHPEVQRKAQAELDKVVGSRRLPDFSDRKALVYINAIVKESLRWHNVVPLGVAHKTTEDQELHGYFIPAGTTVVPNVWACLHDPEIYPEPERFYPERYIRDGKLDPDVLDPASLAFGFGRRVCPGRHFADAGLFITVASVLHVFDISPPLDDGHPVDIKHEQSHGFLSYPENFGCIVKPRSRDAIALILDSRPETTSTTEQVITRSSGL